MSFHHRVTQSFTEFYSFDFKLIKLCETLCYSVVKTHCHTQKTKNLKRLKDGRNQAEVDKALAAITECVKTGKEIGRASCRERV